MPPLPPPTQPGNKVSLCFNKDKDTDGLIILGKIVDATLSSQDGGDGDDVAVVEPVQEV